eukprot:994590_1
MILSLYKSHLTPNTSPPNVDNDDHNKANLFAQKFCHRNITNPNYEPQETISFSKIPTHSNIYASTNMMQNIIDEPLMDANIITNPRLHSNDYVFKKAIKNISAPFTHDLIK